MRAGTGRKDSHMRGGKSYKVCSAGKKGSACPKLGAGAVTFATFKSALLVEQLRVRMKQPKGAYQVPGTLKYHPKAKCSGLMRN